MKIYLRLLLWVVTTSAVASNQDYFSRAQQLYQQQNYDEALQIYKESPEKNAAQLYNMGNCYYKLGDHTNALVCWRKAQRIGGISEFYDAAHNIAMLQDQDGAHGQPWQIKLFHALGILVCGLPLLFLQLLFLLCWLLLIVRGPAYFRAKRYVRLFFYGLLTAILSVLLILIGTVQTQGIALVTQQQSMVFTGPDEHFHVLGELQQGDEVLVKYQENNWYKIQGQSIVGWVLSDTLELID